MAPLPSNTVCQAFFVDTVFEHVHVRLSDLPKGIYGAWLLFFVFASLEQIKDIIIIRRISVLEMHARRRIGSLGLARGRWQESTLTRIWRTPWWPLAEGLTWNERPVISRLSHIVATVRLYNML